MLFYQILACTIHGKIFKKSYRNNEFKISGPTWNKKIELPDGSYSVSDIQDNFKYIIKNITQVMVSRQTLCNLEKKTSAPEKGPKQLKKTHHHGTFFRLFFIIKKNHIDFYPTDCVFGLWNHFKRVERNHKDLSN